MSTFSDGTRAFIQSEIRNSTQSAIRNSKSAIQLNPQSAIQLNPQSAIRNPQFNSVLYTDVTRKTASIELQILRLAPIGNE